MTPDQLDQLIDTLNAIAVNLNTAVSNRYTLTSAADWPILASLGGILLAVISFMWIDLRLTIKDNRTELKDTIDKHRSEHKAALKTEIDIVWGEIRRMQNEHKECRKECCND